MDEGKAPKMGFEGFAAQRQARLGECLWEAHSAGAKILEFAAGRSGQEFEENELLQAAVAAMLGIVSRALEEMRRDDLEEFRKVGEGTRLIEAGLKPTGDAGTWRVVEEVVPEFVAQAEGMLEEWHGG